jgi:hypothetical protein
VRKRESTVVALTAGAVTGAVFVAPMLIGLIPDSTLDPRTEGRVSTADRHQAANVVSAWRRNGEYSECMERRGYDVPWQETIALAPELDDDPALVKLYKETHITEGDEEAVWSTRGFLDAARDCRVLGPERPGISDYNRVKDWKRVLAEARQHGWSPDDPFALD